MSNKPKILYVDDEVVNLQSFQDAFDEDFAITTAPSAAEALKVLEKEEFAVVISDQRMPGITGIELLEKIFRSYPDTYRVILTAYTEVKLLLEAIRLGHVHDYIPKPLKKSALKPVLDKLVKEYEEQKIKIQDLESRLSKTQSLEEEIQQIYDGEGIIGASTGLKKIMEVVKKAAPSDSSILLLGETGVGKDLLAREIHQESKRKNGPFVPVHCAALAKTLLESELFGHEKGAFTGASHARVGRFELANHGTIFLDEIGEIPEDIQIKLLRVLQEREIQRVGGNRLIPIDVRLIAATNKDLKKEVEKGNFREDLFYRLNVIPIVVPPLRDRKEDIPALASFFMQKFSNKIGAKTGFTPEASKLLLKYDWPGNVRELENIIERAVILNPDSVIDAEDLNLNIEEILKLENVDPQKFSEGQPLRSKIKSDEMQRWADILTQTKGNIAEASRILGVARSTLYHRLKKQGML